MSTIQESVYKEPAPVTKEDPLTRIIGISDLSAAYYNKKGEAAATHKVRGIYA